MHLFNTPFYGKTKTIFKKKRRLINLKISFKARVRTNDKKILSLDKNSKNYKSQKNKHDNNNTQLNTYLGKINTRLNRYVKKKIKPENFERTKGLLNIVPKNNHAWHKDKMKKILMDSKRIQSVNGIVYDTDAEKIDRLIDKMSRGMQSNDGFAYEFDSLTGNATLYIIR